MNQKSLAWFVMALLALVVAAYAFVVLFAPATRPPIVQLLLTERPIATIAHLLGGAIAMLVGALQLNASLRKRSIATHRWLGRTYLAAVAIGGGGALAMAPFSFGGLIAQLGFSALAVCWIGSTWVAYRHIRQRDIGAHRRWMIRSYALTYAAVTLRIYMPVSQMAGIDMGIAYPAISWLCWIPNLIVAEWIVRSSRA